MANSIDGRVIDAKSQSSIDSAIVDAFESERRERLGSAQSDSEGQFSIAIHPRRFDALVNSGATVEFTVQDQDHRAYALRGNPIWSGKEPAEPVTLVVTPQEPDSPDTLRTIQGLVTDAAGIAAVGLQVEAYDHTVIGQERIAATTSATDGHFVMTYDKSTLGDKAAADLQIRVHNGDGKVLAESDIVFEASQHVNIDMIVDRSTVPSPTEYGRLLEKVAPLLGGRKLSDLDPHAVTYLSGRTKWDARAIGMAARAEQLSAETHIPGEHYYSLMRSGLPGNEEQIHRLDDTAVSTILKQAVEDRVISTDSIESTVRIHRERAVLTLRNVRTPGSVSSLGEMMALRLNGDQQAIMLEVLRSEDEPQAVWNKLAERGFDEHTVGALQTDAVLGQMTMQNAPLIGRLTKDFGITQPLDLAAKGLHRMEAWRDVIGADVPDSVSPDEYAAGLAADVSLRFPSHVTAHLLRSRAIDLGEANEEVAAFIASQAEEASIGVVPMRTWDGFSALSEQGRAGALKVERLYQITPSNEAMEALSRTGLDSALQVAAHTRESFVAKFGGQFPNEMQAALVHRKAQEVHSQALSIATMFLTYRRQPNLYSLTGTLKSSIDLDPQIAGAATLEDLYGSMDYCTCDHCRSVLSPAAYLVELLELIDRADEPHTLDNPFEVLLSRRPDLQHLSLSCENTNVALPYVDIVLEILEHWVVNGDLATFAGHNVRPDATTADLLANPDYVNDAAYDTIKAAVFPPGLPFDAPLEQLRHMFEMWDISLPAALDIFGERADANREWLDLNGPEYAILTDIKFRTLPEYFGEPAATTISELNSVIGNAKTFCRRAGISYTELVQILRSRFANPGSELMSLLETLHVSLEQIQQHHDGALSDADLLNLIPAGLDPTAFGGDIPAWLEANHGRIMGTIVLHDLEPQDVHPESDFSTVELRLAGPVANGNQLTAMSFHRLHRFLRIWRKLGWSIPETDAALVAFLPADPAALTTETIDNALVELLNRLAGFQRVTAHATDKALKSWLSLYTPGLDVEVRQERLAKLLGIGVNDLANLLEITGVDPFADDLGSDAPSMLTLTDAVAAVKAAPLKVTDIDFLLRHADASGRLAPTEDELLRDIISLRAALTGVDASLAVPAATADLSAAAAKMALIYEPAIVDRFLALLTDASAYFAPLSTTEEMLPTSLTALAPGMRLDLFQNALICIGPLADARRAELVAAAEALELTDMQQIDTQVELDAFVADFASALQNLNDQAIADVDGLGAEHPELRQLYESLEGETNPTKIATGVVAGILPNLRSSLRETAIKTVLTNATKSTLEVIDALTSGPAVLHADGNSAASAIDDITGLEATANLDTDGTVELLLDPPETGEYLFYVAASPGTTVTLVVDGTTLVPTIPTDAVGELRGTPLALVSGRLAPVTVTLAGLSPGTRAQLLWRSNTIPKAPIPVPRLYLAEAFTRARRSILRIHKVVLLVSALTLTPREVADFGSTITETAGVWSAIAVDGTTAAEVVRNQWRRLAWLLWFNALKTAHEPQEDTLRAILQDPGTVDARGHLVLADVMGWAEADLTALLTAFGLTVEDLGKMPNLQRVKHAAELVARTLQPTADVVAWTTATPDGPLLRSIRARLQERMDGAAWRQLIQSVTDKVRNSKRDALVTYILHHAVPMPEITTADQLYEYFLVDVQMDACTQTSRIRLALSTVQLFINRCLLNLEPRVSPASIPAQHWSWMRRYRVWEANRKIFLFPENWLEPELRAGKSPFFRELESELLTADITQELAETSYLHYLQKLNDVARMEIAGAYLEPGASGTSESEVLHLIGRTLGETREHWYRRYEHGYWTPWEKVTLNIEGDVVIPVVWKRRLFVFWITAVVQAQGTPDKSPQDLSDETWAQSARVDATVTLHRGEYYGGQWSSPKTTETAKPLIFDSLMSFDSAQLRVHTRTYQPPSVPGAPPLHERLEVWLAYRGRSARITESTMAYKLTFTSTNSAPLVTLEVPALWAILGDNAKMLELGRTPLPPFNANSWIYPDKEFTVRVEQPSMPMTPVPMHVLTKTDSLLDGFRVRPVLHDSFNQWELPMFYTDERSVFFVRGDERTYSNIVIPPYFAEDLILHAPLLEKLPTIVEIPIKPVIPKPDDPVVNPPYQILLPGNNEFEFGGTIFDAGGAARPFIEDTDH